MRDGFVDGGNCAPDIVFESRSGGGGVGETLALFVLCVIRLLAVLGRGECGPEIGDAERGVSALDGKSVIMNMWRYR